MTQPVAVVLAGSINEKNAQALKDAGYTVIQEMIAGGVRLTDRTLRDEFAAAALTGYRCAYHRWYQQAGSTGAFADPEQLAKWSYADADAMLVERDK